MPNSLRKRSFMNGASDVLRFCTSSISFPELYFSTACVLSARVKIVPVC